MKEHAWTNGEAFDILAAKGPVDVESVKRKVDRAMKQVRPFLTDREVGQLFTAQDHAYMGEGRGEWDGLIKKIRERLGWK